MRIIVDAFGGDNAPLAILQGCEMAVDEYGVEILLTGQTQVIKQVAKENNISLKNMEIIEAPDVIAMDAPGTDIMKEMNNCSMAEGFRQLAAGAGDAFVTAGSTGACVVGATLIVKRIKGIKRPGIATVMPGKSGVFMLMDSGANIDCRADMLQQFGIMGSIYMERVMGIKNPRVGLVNVGTEEHKGGELQHQTYSLLKNSNLNFIGNIEGRDIPNDVADVVVTDGFTGNIILKLYEGVAMTIVGKIKNIFAKNKKNMVSGAMIMKDMKQFKKDMDHNEYGGAPLLGVSKPVFKAHGSSTAVSFKNAIKLVVANVEGNVTQEITSAMEEVKSSSKK